MAQPKPVGRAVVNTITTKSIFKIHPAIGMGRVGNSNDFFLGSEKPTKGPVGADAGQGTATPPYRDGGGKVKRQAARFYVFHSPWNAKTSKFEEPVEVEPGKNGVKKITWTVHIANRKVRLLNNAIHR